MTRIAIAMFLTAAFLRAADTPAEPGPEATVQQLFDAMAARNPDAARPLFVPEASLFSVRSNGLPNRMPVEEFLKVLGSGKEEWKERMWDFKVLLHGTVAVVWGPYDFHLAGAFSHCGYDSISLLRTVAGWKITYISDTRETSGCVNPIGPPTVN